MTFEITNHFVQQYQDNTYHLSQQKGSRIRNRGLIVESGIIGKSTFVDNYGATEAQQITNRHGDSPLANTPMGRRKLDLVDYDWGDLVDKLDKVKVLNQPESALAIAGANAMGRKIDDVIIAAALGNAYTGETGATPVALPNSQKIGVADHTYDGGSGDVSLTVSKLISTKEILMTNESIEEDTPLFFVANSKALSGLLSSTQVGSRDYNDAYALKQGHVDQFMGFTFIRSERLPTTGGDRQCFAYAEGGLELGIGADIQAEITKRADKRFAWYVYFCMSIGATRLEEKKVVQVLCNE